MSQAASHARDLELQRQDAEEAFERAYRDRMRVVSTEQDWQFIAHQMGVSDHYRRIKR